jgi:hypothetical protein
VKRMKAFCQTHSKNTVWARQPNMPLQHSPWGTTIKNRLPVSFPKKSKNFLSEKKKGGKWKSVSRDHLLDIRALWRDEFEFFVPPTQQKKTIGSHFHIFLSVDDDDDPIVWRNVRKDHHTHRQQQEEQL